MVEEKEQNEPEPDKIGEESKEAVAHLRELLGELKSVEEYERKIKPTSD